MSERRFELTEINPTINPFDTVHFIIDYENPSKNIRNLKDCVECLNEQQAEIERLQKIIDLTSYQLKVQDRILKEVGE